ncbi:MAG: 4Fe-4S dicluster domain-containing protein [Clostridiales Family XIII bacterium]|jgi:formate hydrogenlyase subunit 6/NADH:ubiquinone oxidoreductase subunit I|nr:4Fe-4S dicluster domain-containing protein [Clostridiales Family XIII bacterium]
MANLKIGRLIMRSLFKKPTTKMYPVVAPVWKENTRGHIVVDMDACIFCGICARKCPTDAISVDRETKSWAIQRMLCLQCGCCYEVCPAKCLANAHDYTQPNAEKVTDEYTQSDKVSESGSSPG